MTERAAPAVGSARLERARGAVVVSVALDDAGRTRLRRLRQEGAAKCLLPKLHPPDDALGPLAALVNTAGGLAGGDRFETSAEVAAGASLAVSTQAAERVYRAVDAAPAEIVNRLSVGSGARLFWLPQETILFDGGRLSRRLEAEMAGDATLLAIETVTLGRGAMGETVRNGALRDRWRVRRGGRLVFADALRLDAPIDESLARPAAGDGARALATLLYAAPGAEDRLDAARDALAAKILTESGLDAGASAWNGLLVVRCVAKDAAPLRRLAAALVEVLSGAPPPKLWSL